MRSKFFKKIKSFNCFLSISVDFSYSYHSIISKQITSTGENASEMEENYPWKTISSDYDFFFKLDFNRYKVNDLFFEFSGFKIILHSPYELPNVGYEIIAHFSEATKIHINPKIYDIDERLKSLHYEQ